MMSIIVDNKEAYDALLVAAKQLNIEILTPTTEYAGCSGCSTRSTCDNISFSKDDAREIIHFLRHETIDLEEMLEDNDLDEFIESVSAICDELQDRIE